MIKSIRNSPFLTNLLSVTGARVLSSIILLTVVGYVARVVGPGIYGAYAFGLSVISYATILLGTGLTIWGNREIARDKNVAGSVLVIVNGTMLVLACFAYIIVASYAYAFLSGFQFSLTLLCGTILFSNATTLDWVSNGLEKMHIAAGISVFSASANVVVQLVLIHTPSDIYYLPIAISSIALLCNVLQFVILIRYVTVRVALPKWAQWKRAVRSAIPLGTMAALITLLHYANTLIVAWYRPAEELGMFYAAFKLFEYTAMIPSLLLTVFLPRLSKTVQRNPEKANHEALAFAIVHMIIGFYVAALFLTEGHTIVGIIYGTKYEMSGLLLRVMSVAVIFNYAVFGYTNCLIGFGKDKSMVLVVIASLLVSVVGGLLFVSKFGILGAAITLCLVDLAGWLVGLPTYKRVVGSLQARAWVYPGIGFASMVVCLLALGQAGIPWFYRLPIGSLLYIVIVFATVKRIAVDVRSGFHLLPVTAIYE